MNSKTILSIVLVILILGSIVGMSLGSRPDVIDNIPDVNDENIPLETYFGEATGVVSEIYPELIIVSKTDIFDQSVVERDLINIKGIKRNTVEFNKQEEDFIVIIRAVIDNLEKENIISQINDLNYLTSEPIEFYNQATIDVKEKVLFTNDQNKQLEYDFVDHRLQGIVGINTIKEDIISGQIQAMFRKEMPEVLMFYEISNNSASPQMIFESINLDILNWEEEYLVNVEYSLENDVNLNEIIDGNVNVNRTFNNVLKYSLDENLSNDINFEYIIDYQFDENKITINLTDVDNNKYLETLEYLEDLNLSSEKIVTIPSVSYSIITLSEIESVLEKVEGTEYIKKEVYKKGIFDLSTININNTDYIYSEKESFAWLKFPEDLNKTNFDLFMQAYAIRNELMFVNLEKE